MKYCEKCGNELTEDSVFCSKCGNAVKELQQDDNNTKECVYCKSKINKKAQVCPICHKRLPMGLNTRLNLFEIILILIIGWVVFSNIIYPMIRVGID